jgi:hypothetical protein
MTSEPDVTRVLTKMGRADFGYRTFKTVANAPSGGSAEPSGSNTGAPAPMQTISDDSSAAAVFSLLGSCIPEAADVAVGPESPPLLSQPAASEPTQVTKVDPPEPLQQTTAPDMVAPVAPRPAAPFQQRSPSQDSLPNNVRTHSLFAGRSMNNPNPFPPRSEPQRSPAGTTTAMATVFRVLTGSRSGSQSSQGSARSEAAFPFRRG